jgi:hypothetical protein
MNDPLRWAAHFRKRAAECIEQADSSFDAGIEAHYQSLAGRYIKLAEAEEHFAPGTGGHDRLLPGLDYPRQMAFPIRAPQSRRGGFRKISPG